MRLIHVWEQKLRVLKMKLNLQKASDELQSKIYTCTYIGGKGWEKPWNKASGHIMDIKCSSPQIMLAGKSMHLIESIGKVRWWVWLCNRTMVYGLYNL